MQPSTYWQDRLVPGYRTLILGTRFPTSRAFPCVCKDVEEHKERGALLHDHHISMNSAGLQLICVLLTFGRQSCVNQRVVSLRSPPDVSQRGHQHSDSSAGVFNICLTTGISTPQSEFFRWDLGYRGIICEYANCIMTI